MLHSETDPTAYSLNPYSLLKASLKLQPTSSWRLRVSAWDSCVASPVPQNLILSIIKAFIVL